MSNFPVSIMPADGLVPLGARTSAGMVMTKLGLCTGLALKGLTYRHIMGDIGSHFGRWCLQNI